MAKDKKSRIAAETVIRPARDDELSAILGVWQKAGVTPPSVTDSIEGLSRLTKESGGLLLVATIDGQIIGCASRKPYPGDERMGVW
jgi:hypothetical protein